MGSLHFFPTLCELSLSNQNYRAFPSEIKVHLTKTILLIIGGSESDEKN